MAKRTIDFGKAYNEQTQETKDMFCEQDYQEIQNLLGHKNQLKKKIKNVMHLNRIPQPVDVNKTLNMIQGWSDNLHARSLDGKTNWIEIIKNSDTQNLAMQVVCGNRNKPITVKCCNFPKTQIIAYIEEIYAKGGYISCINM